MDLTLLPASELAPLLQSHQVSPVELTRSVLRRIEALEPKLNAYITVMREQSLADAEAAEREIGAGRYRGPLHGIPVGLKDLLQTRGVLTTGGSAVLRDYVPETDATTVARLREAGAIIVGKLNMHEFAYGCTNENKTYGNAHNPWRHGYIPGGSSGGSGAAVAAGECTLALGSDTAGSIRMPAACCGVVGLKATYGRISRQGAFALSWSLDHVGPMTRTVTDAALMLGAIAGYDPQDATTLPVPVPDYTHAINAGVRGLRVGIPRNFFFERVHPETRAAVEKAIQVLGEQGAHLVEVSLPHVEMSWLATTTIIGPESTAFHEPWLRERSNLYDPDVRVWLEGGEVTSATQYLKAQRLRTLIKQSMQAAMEQVDVIAAPTVPAAAIPYGQYMVDLGGHEEDLLTYLRFTCPANATGQPAIAVPCGFSAAGLPLSLQLMGRPFEEETLLRAARAYEAATDWHTRRPAV